MPLFKKKKKRLAGVCLSSAFCQGMMHQNDRHQVPVLILDFLASRTISQSIFTHYT
jgi:hypothetical protein